MQSVWVAPFSFVFRHFCGVVADFFHSGNDFFFVGNGNDIHRPKVNCDRNVLLSVLTLYAVEYILTLLPKLQPFSELDIQGELGRIEELFTEETAEQLCEYFRQRALTANMDFGYIFAGHFPKGYDKDFCV